MFIISTNSVQNINRQNITLCWLIQNVLHIEKAAKVTCRETFLVRSFFVYFRKNNVRHVNSTILPHI